MDTRVTVWRPVNGISINGEMEQLLNENNQPQVFGSQDVARNFLKDKGLDPDFYTYYPELCDTCKKCHLHTLQEAEEMVDPQTGDCPEYDFQDGGRV